MKLFKVFLLLLIFLSIVLDSNSRRIKRKRNFESIIADTLFNSNYFEKEDDMISHIRTMCNQIIVNMPVLPKNLNSVCFETLENVIDKYTIIFGHYEEGTNKKKIIQFKNAIFIQILAAIESLNVMLTRLRFDLLLF
jgi:hypothetical protein